MTEAERAITYAEENRQTHVEWIEFWKANPCRCSECRALKRTVGGIAFHRGVVKRYDVIIKVLRSVVGPSA